MSYKVMYTAFVLIMLVVVFVPVFISGYLLIKTAVTNTHYNPPRKHVGYYNVVR